MLDLFELAEAMKFIYKIGYRIREEHITELNAEQYLSLAAQGMDAGRRWYRITRGAFEPVSNELYIVDRHGVVMLMKAITMVIKTSEESGEKFKNFRERLDYCKNLWPQAITEPDAEKTCKKQEFRVITGGGDPGPEQKEENESKQNITPFP